MNLFRLALGPEIPEVKFKKNKFIGLSKTNLSVLALGPETSRS